MSVVPDALWLHRNGKRAQLNLSLKTVHTVLYPLSSETITDGRVLFKNKSTDRVVAVGFKDLLL